MKTLQELYNEVIASEELKKEYLEAAKNKNVMEFLKSHSCEATAEDFKTFVIEQTKANADKELSADELENVAGGTCNDTTTMEKGYSIFTLGIECAFFATYSAISGHAGQETDSEGRLCSEMDASDYDDLCGG